MDKTQKSPEPTDALGSASSNAHTWLKNQMVEGKGMEEHPLLRSYQDDPGQLNTGWVYDQAIATIAFLVRGDHDNAFKILQSLERLQQHEMGRARNDSNFKGSLRAAYDVTDPLQELLLSEDTDQNERTVGNMMWVALAATHYELHTGRQHEPFRKMKDHIFEWAKQFLDSDGLYNQGMRLINKKLGMDQSASSEHNIDAYAALMMESRLPGRDPSHYSSIAERLKNNHLESLFRFHHGRSFQGGWGPKPERKPDGRLPLDVMSWSTLALGPSNNSHFGCLTNCSYYRCTVHVPDPLIGFNFIESRDINQYRYEPDIWLEGTAQMATACKVASLMPEVRAHDRDVLGHEADFYIKQILKTQKGGGIPYSLRGTHNTYFVMSKSRAVSSTAWLILAIAGYNPLFAVAPDSKSE